MCFKGVIVYEFAQRGCQGTPKGDQSTKDKGQRVVSSSGNRILNNGLI